MSQAPPIIATLIDRFEQNRESYKSQSYNETQVRREFLDPLFEALGWDVANRQGHAEAYKDVIHEDAIKIGGYTKAPDYCFRIGGARKFFLEAKKPAVNVKDEIPPAYQIRRYAWSAKLPLSILTDFEEFAVYDCRTRPNPSDKPSAGRILYLTYRDYLTRWDAIASIFSKEAVLNGSFDKYAVTDRKRGTATVDAEFLKEIETWREALAKNLALRNPKLSVHELNFSVQRTIDRLIFLRIAEDRGIEPYAQLQALLNGQDIYGRLRYLYAQADDRYNSGLFHFQSEKGRTEAPDKLTPSLNIDDKTLKDIIGRLYYPNSPYEFSVFPTEILGQVYEQFLGKVIRLTSGHQAKIEEKPEVKKAGGVYYTPAYIVEYIVKQTVGVLCDGKTPKQIAKLTILDPACGSGSFLLGAYRYLLNYHRDWYVKDGPEKHRKELFQAASGEWRLTTQEKKRILLNNIYGVDIDSQAVEVTKLSLSLKVLEGESDETLKRQLSFVQERALPDLGQNIKCGNSLIEPDYFAGQLMPDDEEMRRVNPFDWRAEFPEIMRAGGFDAVIGNPPYVFARELLTVHDKDYFAGHYRTIWEKPNTYMIFMEQGISLVSQRGMLSFIVPNSWLTVESGKKLRDVYASRLLVLADLLYPVFSGATVETVIFVARKDPHPGKVKCCTAKSREELEPSKFVDMSADSWRVNEGKIYLASGSGIDSVLEKVLARSKRIGDVFDVKTGLQAYEAGKGLPKQSKNDVANHVFDYENKFDQDTFRYLNGKDVGRYGLYWTKKWLRYGPWLSQPRIIDIFKRPRILLREITSPLPYCVNGAFCRDLFLNNKSILNILHAKDSEEALFFLLGQLNSRLLSIFYKHRAVKSSRNIFPKIVIKDLRLFPCMPFRSKSDDISMQVILRVKKAHDLQSHLRTVKTPDEEIRLNRQIDATDQEIDRLVYDLYGLTEEEVKIVESASVASSSKVQENDGHEPEAESADRHRASRSASATVAGAAQYPGEGGGGAPESVAGTGESVHGVREPTGQYGAPQDPDGDSESQSELGATRHFDTAEGRLSYSELSERLAVPLVAIYDEILQTKPDQIVISPEWLCVRHQRLASHLFPDWAGRFRDVNVQVGVHTPPPFYEVPIHMRQFCDDLAERLRHEPGATLGGCAGLLAWADWRFQWIHPFKDFNGRIGRVLLAALLYKLALPHVETAPLEALTRRQYLEALRSADDGNLELLIEIWTHRLSIP